MAWIKGSLDFPKIISPSSSFEGDGELIQKRPAQDKDPWGLDFWIQPGADGCASGFTGTCSSFSGQIADR